MAPFRPPGRSNRSGRTQADNDVFEGLPVKQWIHAPSRVSLVPPTSEAPGQQGHDKWAEPPMPRDYQLLQPWTQQLLKLVRSGKLGQKRKATREADEADGEEYGAREDDANGGDDSNTLGKGSILSQDRAFVAKKWRHVPEHALVPEHLHMEFLARSRSGLPSFYLNFNGDSFIAPLPMRKTKIWRLLDETTGEVAVHEILVHEGQPLDNEILEDSELASKEVTVLPVGTLIEGFGTANPDGVLVAELKNAAAVAQRRNRPPPKKKGGPGRGKKRVTFTNPDGSTYTTVVPNATKIVPQPGQTVKHVAKGEEAARDISAEEAAILKVPNDEDEGDDDDDGDEEDGEDGDDREDGELLEEGAETVTKPGTPQAYAEDASTMLDTKTANEDPAELNDAVEEDSALETSQMDIETSQTAATEELQSIVEPTEALSDNPVEGASSTDLAMADAGVATPTILDAGLDLGVEPTTQEFDDGSTLVEMADDMGDTETAVLRPELLNMESTSDLSEDPEHPTEELNTARS